MTRTLHTGLTVGMRSLAARRGLLVQLTARDLAVRYRSSVLGLFWILGQPLLQLAVYGFVFRIVLRSRSGITLGNGTEAPFGIVLFLGLLLHSVLAETLARSPTLITSNVSYVKRVIFPLEVLPLVGVASSLVNVAVGVAIVLVATGVLAGGLPLSVLLLPLPVLLLALMAVGVGWLLSALGVFFRDLGQLATTLSSILLFTAPICYPVDAVPERFRPLLLFNPLTVPVECARTLLFGGAIQWNALAAYALCAGIAAVLGLFLFLRMRRGFADAV